MKTFYFYFQLILFVIIGFCGLTLIIGGLCMSSWTPVILGCIGLGLPLFAIKDKWYE